jgi:hypothetical protein
VDGPHLGIYEPQRVQQMTGEHDAHAVDLRFLKPLVRSLMRFPFSVEAL